MGARLPLIALLVVPVPQCEGRGERETGGAGAERRGALLVAPFHSTQNKDAAMKLCREAD